VAPDAKLIIGRVCGDEFCDDSAVLAGMEWAAGQHAKVVNMSLGAAGGDGTDPESVAINNLTASSGTLFVVAAGNDGTAGSVSTPAVADAALAVASVGRTDVLSDFSSRGPRGGDFAVKPDIAAPGEHIIAARAAGTSLGHPVDQYYTDLSGTSMATPHVSGTAAILAQQHPDWTPAQLKATLMSTAKPIDATVYGQGAGRVDIGRAVTQPVNAEPGSVSFGFLRWPISGHQPGSSTVTYHNDGNAAVTLTLALTATDPAGKPAPAGVFTTNTGSVTVPAHGTAPVSVTEHPDVLAKAATVGAYSGRLVATGPGGVVVQTALGVTTEQESYDVTVKVIDRTGKAPTDDMPTAVYFTLLDQTHGVPDNDTLWVSGSSGTIRLPKGGYGLTGIILTQPDQAAINGTLAAVPRLAVDHAGIALTFDARRGHKVDAIVDAPNATRFNSNVTVQYTIKTPGGTSPSADGLRGGAGNDLYAIPVTGDPKTFAFGYTTIRTATGNGPDRTYYLAFPVLGRIPNDPRFRVHDHALHAEDARYHAQGVDAAIGDRFQFAYYLPKQNFAIADPVPVPMPSRRLEFYSINNVRWSGAIWQQYLPGTFKFFFEGAIVLPDHVYRPGLVRQEWNNAVFGPDLINGGVYNEISRTGNRLRSSASSFAPGDAGHGANPGYDLFYTRGTATLSRDGKVVATGTNPGVNSFILPADTGRYTLALAATRARAWTTLATKVNTTWTFTSGPSTKPIDVLSLPALKVTGDFDGSDRAAGGAPFVLDITAVTQAGATASKVTAVSLEISDDDGATWTAVRVNDDKGDRWHAPLGNPAVGHGTGYVSLRLKATNALGNTIEETVIRAYRLK
jgi:hypothetical protein